MLWCKVLNSALVPLVVNLAGFEEIRNGHYRKIYNSGMMVEDISLVMLILTIAEPIWVLISPGFLWEKRKRCCLRKSKDGQRLLDYDQEEANELFEKEEVELAEQILNNFALLIIALIYISIIPGGLVLCPIAFAANYFFFKYKLLKHHQRPQQLNDRPVLELATRVPWFVLVSIYMLVFHTWL